MKGKGKRKHSSGHDSKLTPNRKGKPANMNTPPPTTSKEREQSVEEKTPTKEKTQLQDDATPPKNKDPLQQQQNTSTSPYQGEKQEDETMKKRMESLETKMDKILEGQGKMDQMITMLKRLTPIEEEIKLIGRTVQDHDSSLKFLHGEMADLKMRIVQGEEQMKNMGEELEVAKNTNKAYLDNLKKLEEEMKDMDAGNRRDNLLIFNVQEEKGEDCKAKVARIIKEMEIQREIMFSRVHRIGRFREGSVRPIMVRFVCTSDRDVVWRGKSKLQRSKVVIREDYSATMEKNREVLMPICSHARLMGKEAIVVKDTMYVEGRKYNAETLTQLPEELQPKNLCEKKFKHEGKQYVLFGGKHSPLSNWFKTSITINKQNFNSVEQFYVFNKAKFAKDDDTAERVLKMDEPREMKKLSKKIRVHREAWITRGEELIKEGVKEKFKQNQDLRKHLMSTAGSVLVEATWDRVWGSGIPLYKKESQDPTKWKGANQLGKMLAEIRAEMTNVEAR